MRVTYTRRDPTFPQLDTEFIGKLVEGKASRSMKNRSTKLAPCFWVDPKADLPLTNEIRRRMTNLGETLRRSNVGESLPEQGNPMLNWRPRQESDLRPCGLGNRCSIHRATKGGWCEMWCEIRRHTSRHPYSGYWSVFRVEKLL